MTDEVTVMSVKGQVVIPKGVRKKLQLKPRDRFIVYGEEDTIIMKRLNLPELKETFEKIKQIAKGREKKHGRLSQKEIDNEVTAVRHAH
ncbi:looped-hinge helix DNA binding domain, AbrB family [mine drainage metagenome]|uniref:Looped-hinge helix DNA binding domain, AbrB family n=1 Tax=mine drainage metagenome TaxID=410659 RepID=T1BIK9_9ZZZZ